MDPVKVDRPIFIIGPHRSGTTLLYKILGSHPDVGYYNRANRSTPNWPRLAMFRTRLNGRDDPMEAQNIWDRYWTKPDDFMDERDATPELITWFHRNIAGVLKARGATRFLAKYPRLSLRVPWLNAIFPDALIIHLQRDWRAVVQSTAVRIEKRRGYGGGWFGVRVPERKTLEGLPAPILAGHIFRFVSQEIEKQRERIGTRFLRVRYEDVCTKTFETLHDIATHCDLCWSPDFEDSIPRDLKISDKWRTRLDPDVIETIRAEDPEFFRRYEV